MVPTTREYGDRPIRLDLKRHFKATVPWEFIPYSLSAVVGTQETYITSRRRPR